MTYTDGAGAGERQKKHACFVLRIANMYVI